VEVRKLTGGKVVGVNPDRLQIPLYADAPKVRVGAPGTLFGNVGFFVQVNECSKRQFGIPEPTLVKVIFREIDTEVFLVIGIARAAGPDVYDLKFESGTKAPTVRGLKLLFEAAGIALRGDLWYEIETEIVEDEELGFAVAANWTHATTRPRTESEKDVAAGQQPGQ
jgi:hypothetical protein